jgi:hypothetical protein
LSFYLFLEGGEEGLKQEEDDTVDQETSYVSLHQQQMYDELNLLYEQQEQ